MDETWKYLSMFYQAFLICFLFNCLFSSKTHIHFHTSRLCALPFYSFVLLQVTHLFSFFTLTFLSSSSYIFTKQKAHTSILICFCQFFLPSCFLTFIIELPHTPTALSGTLQGRKEAHDGLEWCAWFIVAGEGKYSTWVGGAAGQSWPGGK